MAPTRWVVALILGCLLLAATVVNSFKIRDAGKSSAEVSKEVPFQKVRLDIIKRDPGKALPKSEPEIKPKPIPAKQKTEIIEDAKLSSKVTPLKPSVDVSKMKKPILPVKKPVISFKISKKDDDDDDDEDDSDNSDNSDATETESDLSDNEDSNDDNSDNEYNVTKKKNHDKEDEDSEDDDSENDDDDDDDSEDDDDDSDNSENDKENSESDKDNKSDDDDDDEDDDDDDDESSEDEDSGTDSERKKYGKNSKTKKEISDNDDDSENDSEDDDDDDSEDDDGDKDDTSDDDQKKSESESDTENDDDDDDDDDDDTGDSGSDTENEKSKDKTDSDSDNDKSDDDDEDEDEDNTDDNSDDDESGSDKSEKDDDDSDNDEDDSDAEKSDGSDKESETDETSDSESDTIKIGSKFKLKTVIPQKPQVTKESLKPKTVDIKPSTVKIDSPKAVHPKPQIKESHEPKKPTEKPTTVPKISEPVKVDPPKKIDIPVPITKKPDKEKVVPSLPKKTEVKPEIKPEPKKDVVPDIKKQAVPTPKPPPPKPIPQQPPKPAIKEIPIKPPTPTPKPKQTEDKKEKDKVPIAKKEIVKEVKISKPKKPQKAVKKRGAIAPGVLRRKNMHASDFDDFYAFLPTFAPNFSRIHNPECRRHGKILIRQLRGAKIWTLQMLDSTAKIPSGLLRGNGNQLGDFDQCLGTKARVRLDSGSIVKVSGKYCLAQIDIKPLTDQARLAVHLAQARSFIRSTYNDPGHFIPRFTTLNWGVCLPASCEAEDAEFIIKDSLRHYNGTTGLKININVDPVNCYENNPDPWYEEWLDIPTILTLSFYTIIICIAAYSTAKDYWIYGEKPSTEEETNESVEKTEEDEEKKEDEVKKEDNEEEKPEDETKNEEPAKPSTMVLAFSLKQSVGKLFREGSAEGDIECIHGIRALCSIALYIAHKLIPLGMMPFTNRNYLTEVSNSPFSSALRASLLYTDTFLLLSGVLTAYHMSQDIDKSGSIPWLKRYIARYIRLTPSVIAVLLWYAWISDKIGEGPMWGTAVTQNAELCQQNMWKNIFYIQNFFPFEEMCAPHTHQLALDMQLWWLAPFSVWILRSKPMLALPILGVLHSMAVYLRYSAALGSYLSLVIYHGITVRQLFRTANLCYTLSLHRATPYLAGIGLGVLLQQFTKQVALPKLLYIPGWLISLYFGCWAIYTPAHMALRDYQYDASEAAQYAALASVAWALALSWVIFACFTGSGGLLNKLLCSRPLVVISRISYCMYLCQFLIFFYNVGSARSSSEFTISHGINVLEVISVFVASIILTLLFDIPMQTLRVSIMNIEIKSSSSEETDKNEAKYQPEEEKNQEEVEETSTEERVKDVSQEVIYEEDEEETMIHHDVEQDIIYEEEEEEMPEGEGEPEYEYVEEIVWVEEEVEEEEEEEADPENKETEKYTQENPEEGGGQEDELEDFEWTNENNGGSNQFYSHYRRW